MKKRMSDAAVLAALAAASISNGNALAAPRPSCPAHTRADGGSCVLDADLTLTEPLELPAFATLNCRGRRILPTSAGSGSTESTYVASVPAVAVVITGAQGADVRNCRVGEEDARFDFGVIALNAKNAGKLGHRIHDNEIHARDTAVTLLRVDDATVNDNVITWTNGFGVWVGRDSDRNRIHENSMRSEGLAPAPSRYLPGGPFVGASDDAILVAAQYLVPLLNLVVGDRLYQFPNSEDGQYGPQEDNVVEGNDVSLPGSSLGKQHAGVMTGNNALRTRVVGNRIVEAGVGISLSGLRPAQAVPRAGHCVSSGGQETPRFCQTDADCFIDGIDDTSLGTCPILQTDVRDLRAVATRAERNTLIGPFTSTDPAARAGIFGGNGTAGAVIRGNHVIGTATENGITLAGATLESAIVTGNVVHGASFGLLLSQNVATTFGAQVSLNDITGSVTRAVGVVGTYTLPTELSWNGVGNYWGHSSPPCFTSADTPLPGLIQDSHPSCTPVASTGQ